MKVHVSVQVRAWYWYTYVGTDCRQIVVCGNRGAYLTFSPPNRSFWGVIIIAMWLSGSLCINGLTVLYRRGEPCWLAHYAVCVCAEAGHADGILQRGVCGVLATETFGFCRS